MIPLIAPKPIADFAAEEYLAYVKAMYALPVKRASAKPRSPVVGVTVSRSKAGKLTLRRTKVRAFAYLTHTELAALAAYAKITQAELFVMARLKKWIVAKDRLDAEQIYADIKSIPF